MVNSIANASEQYRNALTICREVFAAAGRTFVEPQGVCELLAAAREAYTQRADEVSAIKEVGHAKQWLIGTAIKFLRGGVEYFDGRIKELSYMALDRDIMENVEARLREYQDALVQETSSCFDQRLVAYSRLASAVNGARDEQARRVERREERERERIDEAKRLKVIRDREQEEAQATARRLQQQEAEAAAKLAREQQFDELFA